MKIAIEKLKNFKLILCLAVTIASCSPKEHTVENDNDHEYTVAAYIWPSQHDEPRSREILWPEGMGEWEVIKKGTPRFEGHYQPKVPLWGYQMDDDPRVMEQWISTAKAHGVNTFIFDWYWFDGGPFLEESLNNGFLKANNSDEMNFYIMWANHDVKTNYWNVHKYGKDTSNLWQGAVSMKDFRKVCTKMTESYFLNSNYFKIGGSPVFSIFNVNNFIKGLGGREKAKEALDFFKEETKQKGFPNLHIQIVVPREPNKEILSDIAFLGIDSATKYNWGGPHPEDYIKWGTEALERRSKWDDALDIPFFPNASIGWDDTPRFPDKGIHDVVHYNKSPESFAAHLQQAKNFVDSHPDQPKIITVFSWNEWVEGGYLLPDMKYGFQYLEAVQKVMSGTYEKSFDAGKN